MYIHNHIYYTKSVRNCSLKHCSEPGGLNKPLHEDSTFLLHRGDKSGARKTEVTYPMSTVSKSYSTINTKDRKTELAPNCIQHPDLLATLSLEQKWRLNLKAPAPSVTQFALFSWCTQEAILWLHVGFPCCPSRARNVVSCANSNLWSAKQWSSWAPNLELRWSISDLVGQFFLPLVNPVNTLLFLGFFLLFFSLSLSLQSRRKLAE
jgi:hypothetical protein